MNQRRPWFRPISLWSSWLATLSALSWLWRVTHHPDLTMQTTMKHEPVVGWYGPHDFILSDGWEHLNKSSLSLFLVADRHTEFGCDHFDDRKLDGFDEPRENIEMPPLIAEAKQHDFKVILMLGGWGGSNFFAHCAKAENRAAFANTIYDYLVRYKFDGVDVDWEHIGIGGSEDWGRLFSAAGPNGRGWMSAADRDRFLNAGWVYHDGPRDWTNYLNLLRDLRRKFNQHEPPLLLLSAMSLGGHLDGCKGRLEGAEAARNDPAQFRFVPCEYPDWPAICRELDYLGLMSYEFWGDWFPFTGHHAPLACDPRDPLNAHPSPPFSAPCEPRFSAVNAIEWFLDPFDPSESRVAKRGGCPAEKLLLGLPLFGKTVCQTDGLQSPAEKCTGEKGAEFRDKSWAEMRSIPYFQDYPEFHRNATYLNALGYEQLVASYHYDPHLRQYTSYDSPTVIFEKTKLAAQRGLAGYFFWDATMDHHREMDTSAYRGFIEGRQQTI